MLSAYKPDIYIKNYGKKGKEELCQSRVAFKSTLTTKLKGESASKIWFYEDTKYNSWLNIHFPCSSKNKMHKPMQAKMLLCLHFKHEI